MRTSPLPSMIFVTVLVMSCGCEEGRPGVVMTSDGRFASDSAANRHDNAVATIERDLQAHLGAHWRVKADIAEMPVWKDDRDDGDWRWPSLDCSIELVGDGQAPPPMSDEEIRSGVERYLGPHVDRPGTNLHVAVARSVDPARHATLSGSPSPASASSAAPASATTVQSVPHALPGNRTYVVQPKDTIADISTAFYGSPEKWRAIVDANPGLDPAALVPGSTVVIPADR